MNFKFDENGFRLDIKTPIIDIEKEKKKRLQDRIATVIDSSSFALFVLAYVILSLVLQQISFPSHYASWVVFVPIIVAGTIPGNIYRAIVKKDFNLFPIWGIALLAYLICGTFFSLWHPYWLIMLIIPCYYCIFSTINRLLKDKKDGKI